MFANEHLIHLANEMYSASDRFETDSACLFHNCTKTQNCFSKVKGKGPMTKNEDRRVQRTQQLLRTALFTLIQEKGFERLSVQDIIDRANVGRATFYAHFDNKEDLLLSGFDGLRESLKERQREARSRRASPDEQVFAFSHDMIAHVGEYRQLFKAMAGRRSGATVQNVIRKIIVDLVRDDLKAMVEPGKSSGAANDAAVEFIAGGLFGLLLWWLGSKGRLSVEEMNALFQRFANTVRCTAAPHARRRV